MKYVRESSSLGKENLWLSGISWTSFQVRWEELAQCWGSLCRAGSSFWGAIGKGVRNLCKHLSCSPRHYCLLTCPLHLGPIHTVARWGQHMSSGGCYSFSLPRNLIISSFCYLLIFSFLNSIHPIFAYVCRFLKNEKLNAFLCALLLIYLLLFSIWPSKCIF